MQNTLQACIGVAGKRRECGVRRVFVVAKLLLAQCHRRPRWLNLLWEQRGHSPYRYFECYIVSSLSDIVLKAQDTDRISLTGLFFREW
jgi:hypothetical protein